MHATQELDHLDEIPLVVDTVASTLAARRLPITDSTREALHDAIAARRDVQRRARGTGDNRGSAPPSR
jgi:hypothetical protein